MSRVSTDISLLRSLGLLPMGSTGISLLRSFGYEAGSAELLETTVIAALKERYVGSIQRLFWLPELRRSVIPHQEGILVTGKKEDIVAGRQYNFKYKEFIIPNQDRFNFKKIGK